jgi:hypothetical protein
MRDLIEIAQRLQTLISGGRVGEGALLSSTLDLFTESGFASARYYEINPNGQSPKDDLLFLRMFRYADGFAPKERVEIPYHTSTIAAAGAAHDIAFGDAKDSPGRASVWINALGLKDQRWVDILLRDQDAQPIALLALAVDIEAAEFDARETFAFSLVKLLMEHHLTTQRLAQIGAHRRIAREFINRNRKEEVPLAELASVCAKLALSASGAQACAIFNYRWADRQLVKMSEETGLLPGPKLSKFEESYFVGENLTGAAWDTPRYGFVENLGALAAAEPGLVNDECVKRHETALGPAHSLLIRRVGTRFVRLQIRLINRADDPTLPFNKVQRDTFESVCHELAELVDEYSNQIVIRNLGQLAAMGLRAFSNVAAVERAAIDGFADLGFDRVTLLYRPAGSSTYEVIGFSHLAVGKALRADPIVAEESPVFERLTQKTGIRGMEFSSQNANPDQLTAFAEKHGFPSAIAVTSLQDGKLDGAKIVALRFNEDVGSAIKYGTQLHRYAAEAESLAAMASIVRASLEASRSHVSAEFAEELVAHFGHEVGTPIVRLQSKAVSGVNEAIKALRGDPAMADTVKSLERRKAEINRQSNYISQQMKAAVALANHTSGMIDVSFENFGWKGLIESAWEEAIAWKESDDGQSSARNIYRYVSKVEFGN